MGATTSLLVPGFDQRAVGLDHHGSRAVAIAEGEARAPYVVVDSLLGHTVDEAAAHLRFQRLDRQPQLGASKSAVMVISPSPMVTTDDGRALMAVFRQRRCASSLSSDLAKN